MTRVQLAKEMFDVFFEQSIKSGMFYIEDKPDWNENSPEADKGREVFLAMADLAIANRLDLGKGC